MSNWWRGSCASADWSRIVGWAKRSVPTNCDNEFRIDGGHGARSAFAHPTRPHRPQRSCQIFSPIMQLTRGSFSLPATGTIGRSGVRPATSSNSLVRIASLNLSVLDRHHERTGAADHAILVVGIEIVDIHGGIGRLLHH